MEMIPRTGVITLAVCLVSVTASLAPKNRTSRYLSGSEQSTVTSSKIGSRYDLFIPLPDNYKTSNQSYPAPFVPDGRHFPLMANLQCGVPFPGHPLYRAS